MMSLSGDKLVLPNFTINPTILIFEIVNFPFLDGNVPRSILWSHISQHIRFDGAFSHVADFNTRNKLLTQKLLKEGYQYHKLSKIFLSFIADTMI